MSLKFWKTEQKPTPSKKAIEESASIRALKKHIKTLEEINEAQAEQISVYTKMMKKHKTESMEEQLVTALCQMFTPQQKQEYTFSAPPSPSRNGTVLESGREYTDEEIKEHLSNLEKSHLKLIVQTPIVILKPQVKKFLPDISETSIKRAQEIAKELIE